MAPGIGRPPPKGGAERNGSGFNKQQWRKDKFKSKFGNVKEGQGFADDRKRTVLRDYRRLLREEQPQLDRLTARVQQLYQDGDRQDDHSHRHTDGPQSTANTTTISAIRREPTDQQNHDDVDAKEGGRSKSKMSIFKKAQLEHSRRQEEAKLKKEKFQRDKECRELALAKYKTKKLAKNKVLSMRNKKGQPLMGPRLKLLLDEIKMRVAGQNV